MSNEYQPPNYSVVEEEKKESKGYKHYCGKHYGKVWFIVFCCVVVFLIVLITYLALFNTGIERNQHHIHELDKKIATQNHDYSSTGVYSLASSVNLGTEYALTLCHRDLYHLHHKDTKMKRVSIDEEGYRGVIGEKTYIIKTTFSLRYNVEAQDLGFNVAKYKLRSGDRYLVVHYEVVSSYGAFSTIKLVESTIDKERLLKTKRDIVVCSDNPSYNSGVRKCSRHGTLDNTMVLYNTHLFPMDTIPKKQPSTLKPVNSSVSRNKGPTQRTNNPPPEDDEVKLDDDGIDLLTEEKDGIHMLENELSHIRLFHLVFLKENTTQTRDKEFNEYIVLAVEPTRC